MEVRVDVYGENLITGEVRKTNKAYITYVAVDSSGKPTQFPLLCLNTEEEKTEFEKAAQRREMRLMKRKKTDPEQ